MHSGIRRPEGVVKNGLGGDTQDVDKQEAPASKTTHLTLLGICLSMLILARLGSVHDRAEVTLGGVRLPEVCAWRRLAGIDCAGCGLTRSFVSIMHGRFADAFTFHHLGLPTFLLILLQIPYRLVMLIWADWGQRNLRLGWLGDLALLAIVVLALADWGIRILLA